MVNTVSQYFPDFSKETYIIAVIAGNSAFKMFLMLSILYAADASCVGLKSFWHVGDVLCVATSNLLLMKRYAYGGFVFFFFCIFYTTEHSGIRH